MKNTHHHSLVTTKLTDSLIPKENRQRSYLNSSIQFHTTSVGPCYLWSEMDFLGKLSPFSALGFCTLNLDGKQYVKVSELANPELAWPSSSTHSAIFPQDLTSLFVLLSTFSSPITITHIIHVYPIGVTTSDSILAQAAGKYKGDLNTVVRKAFQL